MSTVRELILGGQRSGKSRAAESRASVWLAQPGCRAVLVATALGGDAEMRTRIERHRLDRAVRVPALRTVEVPLALGAAVREHTAPECMVLIDCLSLWLTNALMPLSGEPMSEQSLEQAIDALCAALHAARGPVVCVSNEIGLGLAPLSSQARRFVDALGFLHQRIAGQCERVTLMVAGQPLCVKPSGAMA